MSTIYVEPAQKAGEALHLVQSAIRSETTRLELGLEMARNGDQAYLAGSITLVDGSMLHFKEFLDATSETVTKLMYTYHYQDASNELIFRYDNARHRPLLRFLEQKHTPGQVVETFAPTLDEVLAEIAVSKG